jgi:hypothetical protein
MDLRTVRNGLFGRVCTGGDGGGGHDLLTVRPKSLKPQPATSTDASTAKGQVESIAESAVRPAAKAELMPVVESVVQPEDQELETKTLKTAHDEGTQELTKKYSTFDEFAEDLNTIWWNAEQVTIVFRITKYNKASGL